MPRCAAAGHLAAACPVALYVSVTPDGANDGSRIRARLCSRHGHVALVLLMKRGANLLAEQAMPEFCLGCAQPTDGDVLEARWYEGDWSVYVTFALCPDCRPSPMEALIEGPVVAETLPPREKTTRRPTRRGDGQK